MLVDFLIYHIKNANHNQSDRSDFKVLIKHHPNNLLFLQFRGIPYNDLIY